jgi:hypothetical protein
VDDMLLVRVGGEEDVVGREVAAHLFNHLVP